MMKWSSHYVPIQVPMHERSIEVQSFENNHLVLFLDSQISLGILLIYRAPNLKDFPVTKVAVSCGNKDHKVHCLYKFKYSCSRHSPSDPTGKKIPDSTALKFFPDISTLGPGSALEWFIALDANIRIPFYFCLLFTSDHSLLCFMSPTTQSTLSKCLIHSHR